MKSLGVLATIITVLAVLVMACGDQEFPPTLASVADATVAPAPTPVNGPTLAAVATATPTTADAPIPATTPTLTTVAIPSSTPALNPVTAVPPQTAKPIPTATPTPTPTVVPPPTAKPVPTVTPTPTPTVVPPPTAKPVPTVTPTPTPTAVPPSTATPVPTVPIPKDTAVFDLGEGTTLLMSPKQPIAGRDVVFGLRGLQPWEKVEVTFADPTGSRAAWIDGNDQLSSDSEGGLLYTFTAYADSTGTIEWTRYGIQDAEGTWRVKLDFDDRKESVTYRLQELQLTGLESFYLGPHMSGLHGPESGVFFSDDVHPALAADVQTRLALASAQMEDVIGEPLGPVPDVYMVGNRVTLDILSQATLMDLGWEGGTTGVSASSQVFTCWPTGSGPVWSPL